MCTGTNFRKLFPSMLVALLTINIIMMVSLQNYTNNNRHGRLEFRPINCVVENEDQPPRTNRRIEFSSRVKKKNDFIIKSRDEEEESDKVRENLNESISIRVSLAPRVINQSKKHANNYKIEIDRKKDIASQRKTCVPCKSINNNVIDPHNRTDTDGFKSLPQDPDIKRMISMLNSSKNGTFFPKEFWSVDFRTFVKNVGRPKRSAEGHLSNVTQVNMSDKSVPNWKKFHSNIRRYSLYESRDPTVDGLLADMATLRITSSEDVRIGTQLKVFVTFEDGGKAVFKPMRYPRDWPVSQNVYVFDDMERHIAEIAASHLDRLLGLCRVPPVVGRKINVTEFYTVAPKSIRETYFTSPAGNRCFFGKCKYYCMPGFAFCGHPDILEVSLMAFLPSESLAKLNSWNQPYRRSYHTLYKAAWEKDDRYCKALKKTYPYNRGKLLNDIIDTHTFDFLNGNKDRHSMVFFKEFGNFSFPILFDNGRGYGRPDYDPMSILAPLRQCCRIRQSTFLKYLKLYTGPEKLSVLMAKSLSRDPVAPILTEGHLNAMDRRLVKILRAVAKCLESRPINEVILDDSY